MRRIPFFYGLSNLKLWLDPSYIGDLFTDTARTTQAAAGDAIGGQRERKNALHPAQATAGYRPTVLASGGLHFDGSNDYLYTPSVDLSGTNKAEVWIVAKQSALLTGTGGALISSIGGTGSFEIIADPAGTYSAYSVGNGGLTGHTTVAQDTYKRVWMLEIDYSKSASELTLYRDGVTVTGTRAYDNNNTGNLGNLVLNIGCRSAGTYHFVGEIFDVLVFDSLNDAATRAKILSCLRQKNGMRRDTTSYTNLVVDGHSLAAGYGTDDSLWTPEKLVKYHLPQFATSSALAVPGQTVAAMAADAVSQIDPVCDSSTVLVVWIGANDMSLTPSVMATALSTLQTYCEDRITNNSCKIVLCTQGPQSYGVIGPGEFELYEAVRHDWNTSIRAAVGAGWAHAIADIAANLTIGVDGSYDDRPGYWSDATHYNAAGYGVAANVIVDAILTLG